MAVKMSMTVKSVFQDVFRGNGSNERALKRLNAIYSKQSLEEFLSEFTLCLRQLFVSGQKCPKVDRTLETAARFCASLCEKVGREEDESAEEENTDSLFIKEIFGFIVSASNVKDQWARLRACQFVNKVLSKMTEDACIDDDLCNSLMNHMLERMQDKVPMVRIQAVLSLQRLQCPQDPNCPVIERLLYHMENDPSMEARRAVLRIIAKSNITVPHIIQRTRDVKDGVRRQAYAKVSTIKLRALSIKQRVQLLSDGLKDRSEIVRNFVSNNFVPTWLSSMDGKYLDLLHALYLENSADLGELVLKTLFKSEHLRDALDTLKIIQKDRLIPVEELTLENALFWRCLAEYLHSEQQEDILEEIVPNLSPYVQFIKSYFSLRYGNCENLPGVKHEMILIQLLKMAFVFDFSDEMGRSCLKQQIVDMLMKDNVTGRLMINQLVETFVQVVPSITMRLQDLAEVISEIHQPLVQVTHTQQISAAERIHRDVEQAKLRMKLNELEEEKREAVNRQDFIQAQMLKDKLDAVQNDLKLALEVGTALTVTQEHRREERNDRATLSKCLMIVYAMMQAKELNTLVPQLRTLCQSFVLPCLKVEDPVVRPLASKALATMCLLERDFAKEHMLVFYLQIANSDDDAVCVMAIKTIFDLFLQYGLETFDIDITADEDNKKRKCRSKKLFDATALNDLDMDIEDESSVLSSPNTSPSNSSISLFSIITNLLDCTDKEIRDATVLGLCKLMLAQRITSSVLIMRLIIMWFNPVSEDDNHLRQMLGTFFTQFVTTCDWSITTLEEAFLPTLRTVYEAPNSSPLSNIELQALVRFFVNLTQPGAGRNEFQGNVHNNLAILFSNKVLKEPNSDFVVALLYALSILKVSLDDAVVRDQLQVLADKMKEVVEQKEALRYLKKYQHILMGGASESTVSTEPPNTSTIESSVQTTSNTFDTDGCHLSTSAQVAATRSENGNMRSFWNHTSGRNHLSHGSTESDSSNSPRWCLRSGNRTVVPESPSVSTEEEYESEDSQ